MKAVKPRDRDTETAVCLQSQKVNTTPATAGCSHLTIHMLSPDPLPGGVCSRHSPQQLIWTHGRVAIDLQVSQVKSNKADLNVFTYIIFNGF